MKGTRTVMEKGFATIRKEPLTNSLKVTIAFLMLNLAISCTGSSLQTNRPTTSNTNKQQYESKRINKYIKEIPSSLAMFLKEKKVEMVEVPDQYLRVYVQRGVYHDSVTAVYSDYDNRIRLAASATLRGFYHEIGHAMWDKHGNDGLFGKRFKFHYKGPSQDEFEKVIIQTAIYQTERQKIIKVFKDKGRQVSERLLRKRAINETFAECFESWSMGEHSPLDNLFQEMRYKGKQLRHQLPHFTSMTTY